MVDRNYSAIVGSLFTVVVVLVLEYIEEIHLFTSLCVGATHKYTTFLKSFEKTLMLHWRRKWQLTPVFLPGESQGWGSLVGCHLGGCTESDMTEAT